jgi:hypothetical protein
VIFRRSQAILKGYDAILPRIERALGEPAASP